MRLLIKLRCVENSPYDMQYHYHLQGSIYNLLKGSKYEYIHDKQGYKFFCFSNIFPAYDLKKDDFRTLIISSPDNEFIQYLFSVLDKQLVGVQVCIGSMKFKVDDIKTLNPKIPTCSKFTLLTGTPLIVRIPRKRYIEFGMDLDKKYDYMYWRIDHPIGLFIAQLQTNLLNKYREYTNNSIYEGDDDHDGEDKNERRDGSNNEYMASELFIFQKFKFKKQISTRISMKRQEQIIIGTIWEFSFEPSYNQELIQFGLECGLGERNSLGFGFMNLAITNKQN